MVKSQASTRDRVQLTGGRHHMEPAVRSINEPFGVIGNVLRVTSVQEVA